MPDNDYSWLRQLDAARAAETDAMPAQREAIADTQKAYLEGLTLPSQVKTISPEAPPKEGGPNMFMRGMKGFNDFTDATQSGLIGGLAEGAGALAQMVPLKTVADYGTQAAEWGQKRIDEANTQSRTGSVIGQALPYLVGAGEAGAAGKALATGSQYAPALGKTILGGMGRGAVSGAAQGAALTPATGENAQGDWASRVFNKERGLSGLIGGGLGGVAGAIPGLMEAKRGWNPEKRLGQIAPDIGMKTTGDAIRGQVEGVAQRELSDIRTTAQKVYDDYKIATAPYAGQISQAAAQDLKNFKVATKGDRATARNNSIDRVVRELEQPGKTMTGLEEIHRDLATSERTGSWQGDASKAIDKQLAKELKNRVKDQIRKFAPPSPNSPTSMNAADHAWETYKDAMMATDKYNTKLGHEAIGNLDELKLPQAKRTPLGSAEDFVKRSFQNETSVRELLAMSKNPVFVEKAASEYAANELLTAIMKNPKGGVDAARNFIAENRDWIRLLPGFEEKLKGFQNSIQQAGNVKDLGSMGLKAALGAAGLGAGAAAYKALGN